MTLGHFSIKGVWIAIVGEASGLCSFLENMRLSTGKIPPLFTVNAKKKFNPNADCITLFEPTSGTAS